MTYKFWRLMTKNGSGTMPDRLRYFLIVTASYLLTGVLIALSVSLEHQRIRANFEAVANERGSALLHQFELVQTWTRQHGDIYLKPLGVPVDSINSIAITIADSHLVPTTPDAVLHQIADLSEYGDGIRYHIVESKLPNQANPPDAWEAETFKLLMQKGLKERLSFFPSETVPVHRYMALLNHNSPSTQDQQALSITMPAQKLLELRAKRTSSMLLMHLAAFAVIAGLAHLAIRRTYLHFTRLTQLSNDQKFVIEERTADLSMANTLLAAEVEERTLGQERLAESESRYRSVVESTQDGIALIENGLIRFANGHLAEMLARPLKEVVGADWTSLLPAENRAAATSYQMQKLRGEALPNWLRTTMLHGDSTTSGITVDIQVLPIKGGGSSTAQWMLNARNVTDRLRAERDRRFVAAVFESTAEGIMVTDKDNRIAMINPAFSRITGYRPEEVIGQSPGILSSGRHDKNFYTEMWRKLRETGSWSGEIWNRRKDGSLYVEWMTITDLHIHDGESLLPEMEGCYVATFTDITHRKEAEELLRYKASHDNLTRLPNRSLFEDRLQLTISQAKRHRRSFALLYIDLDYFKAVNDTLGHNAGDELLTEAAQRMTRCIRESDTLSRFGGDEFAALLPEVVNLQEIEDIAGRIVSTLDQPFDLAQGRAKISGSVGIAIYPQHGATADELKHNADLALYSVKQSTRNAYRFYSSETPAGQKQD